MFTLVVIREPHKRSVFTVRNDVTLQEVYRSFTRQEAVDVQWMMNALQKDVAA